MASLSPVQHQIVRQFSAVGGSEKFWLTGGSALAGFYLRHRKSRDLDFFTAQADAIRPFAAAWETSLEATGMAVEPLRAFDTFVEARVVSAEGQTLVQFAQDSPFRLAATRTFPEFPGLAVDDLPDLAANKMLALFGRAMLRDFLDVYFLVREAGFTREDLLAKARSKDPGFDLYWFGVALRRFGRFGPEDPEMGLLLKPLAYEELRRFVEDWLSKIVSDLAP